MKNKLKIAVWIGLIALLIISILCNVKLWISCSNLRTQNRGLNEEIVEKTKDLSVCDGKVNKLTTDVANLGQEKTKLEKQIQELNNTIIDLKK